MGSYHDTKQIQEHMSRLGVTVYDLELVEHVEELVSARPSHNVYTVDRTEAFDLVNQHVDHGELGAVYEALRDGQKNLVTTALEPWHRDEVEEDEE